MKSLSIFLFSIVGIFSFISNVNAGCVSTGCVTSSCGSMYDCTNALPGYYLSGGYPYACSAGSFSSGGNVASCTLCLPGTYSSGTASSCATCPSGTTSSVGSSSCPLIVQLGLTASTAVKIFNFANNQYLYANNPSGSYDWVVMSNSNTASVFNIIRIGAATTINNNGMQFSRINAYITTTDGARYLQPYGNSLLTSQTAYSTYPYKWAITTQIYGGIFSMPAFFTIQTTDGLYLDYQGNTVDSNRANLDSNSQYQWEFACAGDTYIYIRMDLVVVIFLIKNIIIRILLTTNIILYYTK
jgi:hypothetical protein